MAEVLSEPDEAGEDGVSCHVDGEEETSGESLEQAAGAGSAAAGAARSRVRRCVKSMG
ncbi:hypothetical protein [Streptomyces iranensis]|uniref:Uncharacterized protein n=1 Tax=Streptomyces iranensis TaxID=576784 RepID=A0A060ZBD9_9ACTN|nr:hypothetical protein [Streptomyces iranensis]MBP2068714.1 hypothetical protein [Streptomyces iranensis]CDR01356.1 predicted protein [Streptomyces iranensis]